MKSLFIAPLLFISLYLNAQADPELNHLLDSIRSVTQAPGIACAVVSSEEIHIGLSGTTELNGGIQISPQSIFHIGSCTKSFTGLLAVQLEEAGVIRLSDKVLDILPELKDQARSAYAQITLADLLGHQARLRPFTDSEAKEFKKNPSLEHMSASDRVAFSKYAVSLKPVKLKKQPYVYSNAGYVLAAAMMERKSGKTWEELARAYIESRGWQFHLGNVFKTDSNEPWGHFVNEQGEVQQLTKDSDFDIWDWAAPAGDLSMRVTDFAEYVQAQLVGLKSGDDILSQEGYEKLHFSNDAYAFGWGHTPEGKAPRFSTHTGSAGAFVAITLVAPNQDFAEIIVFNLGDDDKTEQEITKLRNRLFVVYGLKKAS